LSKEEWGGHSDPKAVDAFLNQLPQIRKVREPYSDVSLSAEQH
jgi:response regulator RpfG family c-di-GMP phosphodiesterase